MTIEFYEKHIYGIPALFIKNEGVRTQLTKLTGRKTITQLDMNILRKLFKADFVQVLPN